MLIRAYFGLFVCFVAFSAHAQWPPTPGENPLTAQLDKLYSQSAIWLDLCTISGHASQKLFNSYRDKSSPQAKHAFDNLFDCRKKAQSEIETIVFQIKPQLQLGSKAEEALKDVYIFWKAAIATTGDEPSGDAAANKLRIKLERLKTEVTW